MTTNRQPTHDVAEAIDDRSPLETVTQFLDAMQAGDLGAVLALVADKIFYSYVSLPTIRG